MDPDAYAPVPLADRGFLLGDGLFETILADRGRLVAFDEHLARLARGCAVLGLAAPDALAVRALAERALAQEELAGTRAAVRVTWTAGSGGRGLDRPDVPAPRLWVSAAPAPRPKGPVRLATAQVRRNQGSPASRLKSLAYLDNVLARRQAQGLGADEALMLNTVGEIACAAVANVFWIAGDRLFTPSLDCGVLDGILRAGVLAAARRLAIEAAEVRADSQALGDAEAVFVTNSLIGMREVAWLDGRAFEPHAMAGVLGQACSALF